MSENNKSSLNSSRKCDQKLKNRLKYVLFSSAKVNLISKLKSSINFKLIFGAI